MKSYSQKSYPNVKLGFSSISIASAGCVITAMGNMADLDPATANERVKQANGFPRRSGSVIWSVAAKALGLTYQGASKVPKYPSIGCTDHFEKSGYPTHYFIVLDRNTIRDSLDGKDKPITTYNITGFQYVSPGNNQSNPLSMDERKELESYRKCFREWILPTERYMKNPLLGGDGTQYFVIAARAIDAVDFFGLSERPLTVTTFERVDEAQSIISNKK